MSLPSPSFAHVLLPQFDVFPAIGTARCLLCMALLFDWFCLDSSCLCRPASPYRASVPLLYSVRFHPLVLNHTCCLSLHLFTLFRYVG